MTDATAWDAEAKGRPADHPLIVHVLDAEALDAWGVDVPDYARALAAALSPSVLVERGWLSFEPSR